VGQLEGVIEHLQVLVQGQSGARKFLLVWGDVVIEATWCVNEDDLSVAFETCLKIFLLEIVLQILNLGK